MDGEDFVDYMIAMFSEDIFGLSHQVEVDPLFEVGG